MLMKMQKAEGTALLDAVDRRILAHVQAHPELTMTELAERVGLSHTPCWRRLKRMEEVGIIRGRAMLLSAEALGYAISVFAHIKLKNHEESSLNSFEDSVGEHSQIVECFSMSGESDYTLRVLARDVSDYEHFLKKVLVHLPGVASVVSSFALKTIKLTTRVPI
jgi:Lrp/AsnC family transcriptional regulator